MLPIILLSPDQKKAEIFVESFIKKNSFNRTSVFTYRKDKTTLSIDQIRELDSFFVRSAGTLSSLIILYDFDTAKNEAQNALLKTLEEKSAQTQFILVATNSSHILPTIMSRSRVVKIKNRHKSNNWQFDENQSVVQILYTVSHIEKNSVGALEFCNNLALYFKKKLELAFQKDISAAIQHPKVLKEIIRVRNLLLSNNLNPQLAVDHLIIFIKRMPKIAQPQT